MAVMGISDENQMDILSLVAGVLHLGNVTFVEHGNYARVEDPESMYMCNVLFFSLVRVHCVVTIAFLFRELPSYSAIDLKLMCTGACIINVSLSHHMYEYRTWIKLVDYDI